VQFDDRLLQGQRVGGILERVLYVLADTDDALVKLALDPLQGIGNGLPDLRHLSPARAAASILR
jgi:hypothetical protein